MLKRKKIVAALAAAGALAIIGGTAGTADASVTNTADYHKGVFRGVTVYIWEVGDRVKVCDTSANGYAAWVSWGHSTASNHSLTVRNGKGHCVSASPNLQENVEIYVSTEGSAASGEHVHTLNFFNDH